MGLLGAAPLLPVGPAAPPRLRVQLLAIVGAVAEGGVVVEAGRGAAEGEEELRGDGDAGDEVLEDEGLVLELLQLRRREGGAAAHAVHGGGGDRRRGSSGDGGGVIGHGGGGGRGWGDRWGLDGIFRGGINGGARVSRWK